jgi:hypothetical protein
VVVRFDAAESAAKYTAAVVLPTPPLRAATTTITGRP